MFEGDVEEDDFYDCNRRVSPGIVERFQATDILFLVSLRAFFLFEKIARMRKKKKKKKGKKGKGNAGVVESEVTRILRIPQYL